MTQKKFWIINLLAILLISICIYEMVKYARPAVSEATRLTPKNASLANTSTTSSTTPSSTSTIIVPEDCTLINNVVYCVRPVVVTAPQTTTSVKTTTTLSHGVGSPIYPYDYHGDNSYTKTGQLCFVNITINLTRGLLNGSYLVQEVPVDC